MARRERDSIAGMPRRPRAALRRLLLQTAAAWPAGAALGAASAPQPQQPPLKLRLLAEPFPPLQYGAPPEPAHGASIDLVQAALALVAEQLPVQAGPVEFLPLQRALMIATTQPQALVLSIARTPEREARLRWLGTVAPYELWLYRLKQPGQAPLQGPEQLRGHGLRFGVQLRSNFHEWLLRQGIGAAPDNSVIDTVAQNSLNFQKARAGRIDVFAHPAISFAHRAAEHGLRASAFEPLMRIDELSAPLWVATGLDSDERLCALLARAFTTLQRSGRAARLLEDSIRSFNALHRLDGS
jgi:polar amino acid transport system substrate-binding protein